MFLLLSFIATAQPDSLRGMYRNYSAPELHDTPPPKGYKPVYISHYGRHGSRYHLAASIVRAGRDSLRAASVRGTLTPLGTEVLACLEDIYKASEGRWGELTARGALEHQAIAGRMVSRFSPVFKGKRLVEAFATIRPRCRESMKAALGVIKKANPLLLTSAKADKETTRYLKNEDLLKQAQDWYNPRLDSATLACRDWTACIGRLYTDCRGDDMAQMRLARWIWHCWAEAPCLGIESWNVLDWLSFEELRDMAGWFDMNLPLKCLRSDIFLERRIESQSDLLRDIVSRADAALSEGRTAATLRYGHDANLVPLMGLMNAEGFEGVYVLKDRPDPRWNSARMVPMGSNVQLVFYKSRRRGAPVLVKILYNEKEISIAGLDPVSGPYYDWQALKGYWGFGAARREVSLAYPAEGYSTLLIQNAVDSISALGGGRVTLRPGTYLITPIELKSGVDLHLEEGAVLLASPRLEDYPDRTHTRHFDSSALPRRRNIALIYADEAHDISITGKGVIDGNGTRHIREKASPNGNGWPFERIAPAEESLPRLVFFAGCRNVKVQDVTMTNQPAGWGYWVHDCDRVRFKECTIVNDVRYPNNDGIHVNCSRDVFISGCHIEAGDDAIVVRANSRSLRENKPCEKVVVTDCDLRSWSSAVRIGWVNDGAMRDCAFTRLRIWDSSNGIGCYLPQFKYVKASNDYGREATLVEDFWCDDIAMDQVYGNPVYFKVPASDPEVHLDGFRDIRFRNIRARALAGPYFRESDRGNIGFDGCRFEICSPDAFPDDAAHHGYVLNARPDYYVCAYVWPSCHDDSLAHAWLWPGGEGEWEVIRKGNPRFEGHYQPKRPLWGYELDDDPKVVEKWIQTALEYGVNTFIYDWYWYKGPDGYSGPYLEDALDKGFLGAPSNRKLNFYLMYANHKVKYNYWNPHKWGSREDQLFDPCIGMEDWKKIVHRVITKYFSLPNYAKIDGCPVFAMFNADIFKQGFSSDEEAAAAMEYFREEVRKAGFPDLHLQLTPGGGSDPSPSRQEHMKENIARLGINSIAFYNMGGFNCDYITHNENALRMRSATDAAYDIPLFPTVSIGWDDTPRFPAKGAKDVTRFNNTPEVFGRYLNAAKKYADEHRAAQPPFVMINAWNEWVEGSYLLPDEVNGFGYLEQVKKVFGETKR